MAAQPQLDALADAIAERLAQRLLDAEDRRPLYSARTLAERLAISERTIRDLLAAGAIPSVKIGGARRVLARDVDRFLEAHELES